jgi:hypothetical protein
MIDRATEKVVLEGEGGNLKSYTFNVKEDEKMFKVGDVIKANPITIKQISWDEEKKICAGGYAKYYTFFKENNLLEFEKEFAGETIEEGKYTIVAIGENDSDIQMNPVYVLRSHVNKKIYLLTNYYNEMSLVVNKNKKINYKKENTTMAEDMYMNNQAVSRPMIAKPKPEIREITYKATRRPFVEVSKTTGQVVKDTSFTLPELKEKVIYSDRVVIVFLDDGSKGVAKCHPNDEYNPTTGVKIAYTRAKIKSMQKELKKLCKPDGE